MLVAGYRDKIILRLTGVRLSLAIILFRTAGRRMDGLTAIIKQARPAGAGAGPELGNILKQRNGGGTNWD